MLASAALLFFATIAQASELIVPEGGRVELPAGLAEIEYEFLSIGTNASLVIPQSYADKSLTVRVSRFEASQGSAIYQMFDRRAKMGGQGGQGEQPDYGQKGRKGGIGSPGSEGADTVQLTLELGIAALDGLTIVLRSQAGGHGGRGGKGGLGGGSRCGLSRSNGDPGGDGGIGGDGGPGAAPGNVRPLTVRWWPVGSVIPHFRNGQPVRMSLNLQSGQGGWGGPAGIPGNGHGGRRCGCVFGECAWKMPSGAAGTEFGTPGKPYAAAGAITQPQFQVLAFAQ